MSWTLQDSNGTSGKVYARPLGMNETSFYFDRVFNGTADIIWRHVVQQTGHAKGIALFSEYNIKRAWATLKQWYPLLGVRVDDSKGVDAVKFVVSEHSLTHHHPSEVTFASVSSSEEIDAIVEKIMREKQKEDYHRISRLLVFAHRDSPGKYEVLFWIAHAIADGLSGATIARTFYDVLVSPPASSPPLEERLAMALPSDQLNPTNKMSIPRQRWRRAAARIILLNRRRKLAGGHTIPRKVTKTTYRTPSLTDHVSHRFTLDETKAVMATCRAHKITFGTAIAVISQLALTRILHGRYLRGEIAEDEWEYRRRQPMHFGGPVSLRPYMDAEWQRNGGMTEIMLAIDYYEGTLPFMPTPFGTRKDEGVPRVGGAPPYAALMSPERFFLRARMFKKQIERIVSNPLMLDIAQARQPFYVLRKKTIATQYLAEQKGEPLPQFKVPAYLDSVPNDYVPSNGLSSVGELSLVFPANYPLPRGHPLSIYTPRQTAKSLPAKGALIPATSDEDALLRVVSEATYLHSRPMEFFLGNSTQRGHLGLKVTFDQNVYEVEDIREFVQECRAATLHYLGSETVSKQKL